MFGEPAAQPRVEAPQPERQHGKSDADHDAEAPEDQRGVGPVLTRECLQALDLAVPVVGQDVAAEVRHGEGVARGRGGVVGPPHEIKRRPAHRLIMPLDGGDLHWLMLQSVEAVQVAGEHLQRRHRRRHPHGHGQHQQRGLVALVAQQVPGADGADDEGRRQVGGQHHVYEAVGEGWVEDHGPPVDRDELPRCIGRVAGRRVHPAVRREYPEGRHERAEADHQGGKEVQAAADAVHAEQHDAEKSRLQEKRGHHLVAHQRPEHRPDLVGKYAPVGAELVAHDEAGHDAHAEGDGEDLDPEIEDALVEVVTRDQPETFEHGEVAREPNREGRKDDVGRDSECELETGEIDGADVHGALRLPPCFKYSACGVPVAT